MCVREREKLQHRNSLFAWRFVQRETPPPFTTLTPQPVTPGWRERQPRPRRCTLLTQGPPLSLPSTFNPQPLHPNPSTLHRPSPSTLDTVAENGSRKGQIRLSYLCRIRSTAVGGAAHRDRGSVTLVHVAAFCRWRVLHFLLPSTLGSGFGV